MARHAARPPAATTPDASARLGVLIGADGIQSNIRHQLFPEHPGVVKRFAALRFTAGIDLDGSSDHRGTVGGRVPPPGDSAEAPMHQAGRWRDEPASRENEWRAGRDWNPRPSGSKDEERTGDGNGTPAAPIGAIAHAVDGPPSRAVEDLQLPKGRRRVHPGARDRRLDHPAHRPKRASIRPAERPASRSAPRRGVEVLD